MKSKIIIGDVHGCYNTLMELIKQFPEGSELVFAGDLIDRGPDSRKVVNYVIENGWPCVKGNHEDLMLQCVDGGDNGWHMDGRNGGYETLRSYDNHEEDFMFHANWMRNLPTYIEFKDVVNEQGRYLIVSHSGIGNNWNIKDSNKEFFDNYTMWNRTTPVDIPEFFNVFGHTPQEQPLIKDFYANVDTGCVFTGRSKYAVLTAIEFPSMKIYQQSNIEHEIKS